MNGDNYIHNANTPEEHFSNVLFQAANVKGLFPLDRELAKVKAECLLRSAESLMAAFEAEARAERKQPSQEKVYGWIVKQRPCGDWVVDCYDPKTRGVLRFGRYDDEQAARDMHRALKAGLHQAAGTPVVECELAHGGQKA